MEIKYKNLFVLIIFITGLALFILTIITILMILWDNYLSKSRFLSSMWASFTNSSICLNRFSKYRKWLV